MDFVILSFRSHFVPVLLLSLIPRIWQNLLNKIYVVKQLRHFRNEKETVQFSKTSVGLKWNPVNTDTKGTCHNVRIIRVPVLP